jgi:hypothetical protein
VAIVPPQGTAHELHGATTHDAWVAQPERTPLLQERTSAMLEHVEEQTTEFA